MEKKSIMIMNIVGDEVRGSPKPEPAEVYQEAALNLRYKRITAITPIKLERTIALLQLEPCHLVERGLAPRSSLTQGLDWSRKERRHRSPAAISGHSARSTAGCTQKSSSGTEGGHDDTQDDQDDGWGDYEDDYDSDSDIDDHEDPHDETEGRRKGPIYAFLVYGGVQLRPDEYVLLFRALGVSPQYIEQLQHSNSEADLKPHKAPSNCRGRKAASPSHGPSSKDCNESGSGSKRGDAGQGRIPEF